MTQITSASAETPASKTSKRPSGAWPMATVLITLILVLGLPFAYLLVNFSTAPRRMTAAIAQAAADAVRPRLTINEIVLNSIADLHKSSKMIVFETVVNTDVTREEGESSWGVYWGSNIARVAVRDARVQYIIDLSQLGTGDFQYNDNTKILTISLPKPHIDNAMVNIDPARIQTLDLRGGWARFDKQTTRDRAIAELRPKVINQAEVPFVKQLAADAGIDTMTKLLQPVADALAKEGATVKIIYE